MMLTAICGTPGTGKTTAANVLVDRGYRVISLNELIESGQLHEGMDPESGSLIVDRARLRENLSDLNYGMEEIRFLDGHLSYLAPADLIAVLRVDPDLLYERLVGRGYPEWKSRENAEAEALSITLLDSMEEEHMILGDRDWTSLDLGFKLVVERDVTDLSPSGIADWLLVMSFALREKDLLSVELYRPGKVDWTEVASRWY